MALDAQWSAVARGYRFALILAAVVGAAAVVASAAAGHWLAGVFICLGLGLGGWNSRRLWTDTKLLTSGDSQAGDRVRGPALTSSAKRLGLITIFAFLIALAYRPLGWTVFLGLVVFQIVMVIAVLPPLKRIVAPGKVQTTSPPGAHS